MSATNPFDQSGRYLARLDPPGVLAWALNLGPADFAFDGWLDTRLLSFPGQPERVCDTVAHLRDLRRGGEPWAVVLEFQSEPDAEMFGRLLGYLGLVWLEKRPSEERGDRFAPGAVVVNLTGAGRTPRRHEWPEAGLVTQLHVVERNLSRESAADLLAGVAAGRVTAVMLPFVPLMTGGGDAGIIAEWVRLASAEADAGRRGTYGALALVFAEAGGCADAWKQALRGWNVTESKQVLEWQAQAKAESLLEALEARFGPLPADLVGRLQAVTDLAALKRWMGLAVQTPALDQFRQQAGL